MIRNTDGRYWIFTTGDGVWAMSSSNANFADWRVEPTVFPRGTWPSWISNYVSGFQGFFWAPDVMFMNNQYYLYYSCAGIGAPAAIGLATSANLAGPWTDQGMIVAANNAIDPAMLRDGSNLWLTYGNWQSGVDLIQLNPSTGRRLNTSRWDLVAGQVEAPYLIKNGTNYYLFFQRGLCCNGVNSTYYTQVGRSTSITGPYVDKNGNSLLNGGGSTFLPNRDGRYIGPGHVGYGEGKLTYHFYDGNDNGNAKLRITTLSWSDGWPVAGGTTTPPPQLISNGTYRLRNRASGKYLDNLGATADGANVAQWTGGTSNNQRWVVTFADGFYKLRAVTGGKYVDSINRTADGSIVGQWTNSASPNQQWTITATGSFYKVINRTNGKALDTGGSTADGAAMQFWTSGSSNNQQWTFEMISTSTGLMSMSAEEPLSNEETLLTEEGSEVHFYQDPVARDLTVVLPEAYVGDKVINLLDGAGRVVLSETFYDSKYQLNLQDLPSGMYILRVTSNDKLIVQKVIRR
jgi:arabinan endo-1,5-alpha-L-arabinosidase